MAGLVVREPYEHFSYDQLRAEVARRGLRTTRSGPGKNYNKPGFVALLRQHDQDAKRAGSTGGPAATAATVTAKAAATVSTTARHCAFRLLNVLFSDAFASRLAALTDATPKQQRAAFWADARTAFASDDPAFGRRIDDHACLANVHPWIFDTAQSAAALQEMWTELWRAHRRANAAAAKKKSTADFFSFCGGDARTYYLHCWLKLRPELDFGGKTPVPEKAKAKADTTRPARRVLTPSEKSAEDPPHVVAPLPDSKDEVLVLLRALVETNSKRVASERGASTHSQWLELVTSVEQMRERVKRYRAGSDEHMDAEEDLRVALTRKRRLREQLSCEE